MGKNNYINVNHVHRIQIKECTLTILLREEEDEEYSQFVQLKIQEKHPLPQKAGTLFYARNCPQMIQHEDEIGLCKWCSVRTQTLPIDQIKYIQQINFKSQPAKNCRLKLHITFIIVNVNLY